MATETDADAARPADGPLAALMERSLIDAYLDVFKALSDLTRIEILVRVAQADEYPCTALEQELSIGKSTISYHVKILRNAGLIAVRKDGRHYHYRLRADVVDYFVPGFLGRILAERLNAAG